MTEQTDSYRLFIVEDDASIAEAVAETARAWNFSVRLVSDFRRVAEECLAFDPHLVLLDIALPFYNGFYWCGELRKHSNVPILFLSSASDSMNIVMAMNMGGDDFIAKPFDSGVLMAKVQALLRRAYDFAPSAATLSYAGASLSTADQTLTFLDRRIELTKNEYRILLCLMESRGRIVSRERLMETLWQTDAFVDENTLTVNVGRLRKKLDAAGLTDFITTKVGVGYMIG